MVQGDMITGEPVARRGGLPPLLRSRETWRSASRYVLFVVSTLVTLSVLAAAIPTMLGMDSFVIDGGSMRPAVPAGALVVSSRVAPASVEAGQIITFRHASSPGTAVTHRVVKVLREDDGSVSLLTKGDANATADPEPAATELPLSRMVFSVPYAGYVLEFSRTGAGKVALIAIPALLLLLSIRRSSADDAAAEASTLKKGPLTMVAVPHSSAQTAAPLAAQPGMQPGMQPGVPVSALERLAQRPAPVEAPRRPGLGRRLVAAFRAEDLPRVTAMPEAPAAPEPSVIPLPAPAAPAVPTAPTSMTRVNLAPPVAAEGTASTDGDTSLLSLARLRLRSVTRLAEITRSFDRVETEAAPLLDLVADLDGVHDRFSANLDEAMRPLTEFADRWDEDLLALAERMQSDAPLPQMDIAAERRRISEIRAQIPHRHSLLVDQFAVERQAIDAALTVFDEQVARLETQLTAARRTAEAIGDSMRTADFGRTVAFLRRRMERLAELAARGAATPEEIAEALPVASALAADDGETLANSPYLHAVLVVLGEEPPSAHASDDDIPFAGFGAA